MSDTIVISLNFSVSRMLKMKLLHTLALVLMMSPTAALAQDEISSFAVDATVGGVFGEMEDTVNSLLSEAKRTGDDLIISAANTMLLLINQGKIAYEDSLDVTFEELNDQQKEFFKDANRAVKNLEDGIPQTLGTYFAYTARSLYGSDTTPLVISYDAQTFLIGQKEAVLKVDGISFEKGTLTVGWPSGLKVLNKTGSQLSLKFDVSDVTFEGSWTTEIPFVLSFEYKDGWLWFNRSSVDYAGHLRALAPEQLKVRAVYTYRDDLHEYGPLEIKRKDQRRVSHTWYHRLDVVPAPGRFIDVESVKEVDWWEHSECSNGYTDRFFEGITEAYIRAFMQGKEEGGLSKDCGARFIYEYRTFALIPTTKTVTSEPIDLSGREYRFVLPNEPDARFSHFEVTPQGEEPFNVSIDTSPWAFFEAIPSDGRSFLLTIN